MDWTVDPPIDPALTQLCCMRIHHWFSPGCFDVKRQAVTGTSPAGRSLHRSSLTHAICLLWYALFLFLTVYIETNRLKIICKTIVLRLKQNVNCLTVMTNGDVHETVAEALLVTWDGDLWREPCFCLLAGSDGDEGEWRRHIPPINTAWTLPERSLQRCLGFKGMSDMGLTGRLCSGLLLNYYDFQTFGGSESPWSH